MIKLRKKNDNAPKLINITVDKLKEIVVVNSYTFMMMKNVAIPKMLAAILPCSKWATYCLKAIFG